MNVKRWRKYKGAVTVKKSQNSSKYGKPNIQRNSRTYRRTQKGGYRQKNIIGGGGKTEEKAKEKADKEQKEREKQEEKKQEETKSRGKQTKDIDINRRKQRV